MTIKVSKPEVDIREKLSELDFDRVPFQKMPAGSVLQVVHHTSTVADATSTTTEPSNTTGIVLGILNITPRQAGSIFLVNSTYSYNFAQTQNYQCTELWMGRKIGIGNQSAPFTEIKSVFTDYEGIKGRDDIYSRPNLIFIDTPSYSLGQTISYEQRLGSAKGSGSVGYPVVRVRNSSIMPPSDIIVQEIAQ